MLPSLWLSFAEAVDMTIGLSAIDHCHMPNLNDPSHV